MVQGVRKLLEYLTPLGQKSALTEHNSESGGEASASEVPSATYASQSLDLRLLIDLAFIRNM